MVQLILEAAQGASAGLYPDTFRQTERCDLPEGAHPIGTDGFVAGAVFAALARASAQPSAAALLTPKNPFCHCNEHSPQQAAGYLTLAIQGPLTRASTALIPLSVFLVRAHSAPPWPNLLSPPLFQGSSHPTNIVLPIAPFFPIVLAVTLLALLCSYISARSSRALVLDALRIASVRDPYRIPIPPSRSHIVPLSLLSSPPIPFVLSLLSMPSDILPASLCDNVSPTHNAILALIRLFPPSLPSSFLKKSATP